MEQYKVKAKHKQSGIWLFGVPLTIENKDMLLLEDTENGLRVHYVEDEMWLGEVYAVEIDKETICRPTGKTDINGNVIWENDIVGFLDTSAYDNGYAEYYCRGQVMWDEETMSFQVTERISCESYEAVMECDVIGNIFDNPELLETVS